MVEMLEREGEWTGNMKAQGRNAGEGRRMNREYDGLRLKWWRGKENGQGIRGLKVEMLEREEEWTGTTRAQGRSVGEGRMDREYEGSR